MMTFNGYFWGEQEHPRFVLPSTQPRQDREPGCHHGQRLGASGATGVTTTLAAKHGEHDLDLLDTGAKHLDLLDTGAKHSGEETPGARRTTAHGCVCC